MSEPLYAVRNEQGGWDLECECPNCGHNIYPYPRTSWSGKEIPAEECYECGESIKFVATVANDD